MTYTKEQGRGVAETIGVVKWVVIAISIAFGVASMLNIEYNTTLPRIWEVVVLVVTAAYCLWVWVLFGWFQHTLANLVRIEQNTRGPEPMIYRLTPTEPAEGTSTDWPDSNYQPGR